MVGVGWLGVFVTPMVTRAIMPRIQPKSKKKFFLGMLLFLAILLVPCCHQLGSSHLLGAFLAGLCFCTDHEAHSAWQEQVKRVLQWLLKIFFAATIGFEVPVRSFAQPAVIWRAALLCTASIGKVATGVWAVPLRTSEFFTVGFVMALQSPYTPLPHPYTPYTPYTPLHPLHTLRLRSHTFRLLIHQYTSYISLHPLTHPGGLRHGGVGRGTLHHGSKTPDYFF